MLVVNPELLRAAEESDLIEAERLIEIIDDTEFTDEIERDRLLGAAAIAFVDAAIAKGEIQPEDREALLEMTQHDETESGIPEAEDPSADLPDDTCTEI